MRDRAATGVAMLFAGALLTGCTTTKSKYHGYVGNVPDLNTANVGTFATDQAVLAGHFAGLAGMTSFPPANGNWRPVVDGGMLYVDVRCQRFLDALFWLNRMRETTSHQIQYLGAAASAALAVANAAKELIGMAPLGFGLADQTVNNLGQGLLFHLDPGAVAKLVVRKQGAYQEAIKSVTYTNRAAAMNAVQQYAANCLPVTIEGEVTQAIANSEFERVDYRPTPGQPQPEPTPEVADPAPPPPPPPPPPDPASVQQDVVPVIEQRRPQ